MRGLECTGSLCPVASSHAEVIYDFKIYVEPLRHV